MFNCCADIEILLNFFFSQISVSSVLLMFGVSTFQSHVYLSCGILNTEYSAGSKSCYPSINVTFSGLCGVNCVKYNILEICDLLQKKSSFYLLHICTTKLRKSYVYRRGVAGLWVGTVDNIARIYYCKAQHEQRYTNSYIQQSQNLSY